MSTDAFGNEVPSSPGYDKIIDTAGAHLPQAKILRLGAGLTAAHDAATGATILSGADATESTTGLLSAADKTKLDKRDVAYSAAISGTTATASWTAGKYRRLEIILRTATGNAADPTLTFANTTMAGQTFSSNAYLTNSGATGAGAGTWTQADQYAANSINLTKMGNGALMKADVEFASNTTEMTWNGRTAGGLLTVVGGASIGADGTAVSGLTITFAGATAGWLEIIGYP